MTGISLITDPQGQPKILTIDVQHHDRQLDPLVTGLLNLLEQQTEDTEHEEFLYASGLLANRAYADDEPDYTDEHLIERNPNYRHK